MRSLGGNNVWAMCKNSTLKRIGCVINWKKSCYCWCSQILYSTVYTVCAQYVCIAQVCTAHVIFFSVLLFLLWWKKFYFRTIYGHLRVYLGTKCSYSAWQTSCANRAKILCFIHCPKNSWISILEPSLSVLGQMQQYMSGFWARYV